MAFYVWVCCSIWHCGVQRNWQTLKNGVSAWDFPWNWVKYYRNFQTLKSNLWWADSGKNTVFEQFSKFRRDSHNKTKKCTNVKIIYFYTQFCHNSSIFQSILIILRDILCTKFNVFNNPSVFLYMFYWCSLTPWRRQARLKHVGVVTKLCVKKI